jgi:hypothetical protein
MKKGGEFAVGRSSILQYHTEQECQEILFDFVLHRTKRGCLAALSAEPPSGRRLQRWQRRLSGLFETATTAVFAALHDTKNGQTQFGRWEKPGIEPGCSRYAKRT